MTVLVVDASALVAVLSDNSTVGQAAAGLLAGHDLSAPELLPFEVGNVLRRLERTGRLSSETAALAHSDLLDLPVQLWPYAALSPGPWRLRGSLTIYDAAYVALAAQLDAPLVTLDQRFGRAASSSCQVVVPDIG